MKISHLLIPITIAIGIYCLVPKFSLNPLKADTKPKVYFTKTISPEAMVEMYKKLGVKLEGNVALKVHTGETKGKYFLTPDFLQSIYEYVNGTYVECNTAYQSHRHTTELHELLLIEHGWKDKGRKAVIMDADPKKDKTLYVDQHEGQVLRENYVGQNFTDFDSCLVLSHFKGHQMGGFGGALKQLSIGFASQAGKAYIHTGGKTTDWTQMFPMIADQITFTTAMAEAASTIVNHFKGKDKGGMAYLSVVANISISCDCAGYQAPEPKIVDIGILASTDPVAIDQAGLDLIYKSQDCSGKKEWLAQLARLNGTNTVKVAKELGIGSTEYDFEEVFLAGKYLIMNLGIISLLLILLF